VTDTNLQIEYGSETSGAYQPMGRASLIDVGPAPSWRTLRLPMSSIPAAAQVVRIVADVRNPAPDQWIAFTPPRVPHLQTLQHLIGSHTPVLLDWPVPLAFTCQQQLNTLNGVAQLPKYRILANGGLPVVATNWEGPQGGGPVGWAQLLLSAQTVPTYLNHDWSRDWGSLERYTPLVPDARTAALELGAATRSGMWDPSLIQH
ncbi:arabinosyltransferase, partial [Rhodococcus sp. D2-41]|uniref:arabinosyltransferase C-terminal domain-containing protein n=1 Tax=Speluncibacter jeojiensis TaxID=2710754 RepID=UPI00240ED7DA